MKSFSVSAGSPKEEGQWVDQRGTFLATVAAGPVYELLGKQGLGTKEFPPQEAALVSGSLAYRQHAGGHTVGPNWPTFLDFAARHFAALPPAKAKRPLPPPPPLKGRVGSAHHPLAAGCR